MARAKLVLADTVRAAHAFAREMDFERFSYRAVQRAAAIRGVRNAEVYILESFLARPDRHAILHELRFARVEVFYFDDHARTLDEVAPEAPQGEAAAQPDPAVEGFFDDAPEVADTLPADDTEDDDTEVEETPKPRIRRRRCEVCEDLIMPDKYDEHLASHKNLTAPTGGYF